MTKHSLLYQLIEEKLDGTLPEFIATRYGRQSWAAMASELSTLTGQNIRGETLRRWFADRITVEVKVA